MAIKLLITDLDNTLYDWVTFFTRSFHAMVQELVSITGVPEDQLLAEFRDIHQRYGNSEQPFAALELPALRLKFPALSVAELAQEIDPALHRFNSMRKRCLALYPGVAEVLETLSAHGVKIVGHTEATLANSYWRIKALQVEQFFSKLYALEGKESLHRTATGGWIDPPNGFVTVLPRSERKPNPAMVLDICRREGADIRQTFYLGDSLVRDISMANRAGVVSIWARYGLKYDPSLWQYLVKVTHWTDDPVKRERDLKEKFSDVKPAYTIDAFDEIEEIVLGRRPPTSAP